jgi:hypothetical protein
MNQAPQWLLDEMDCEIQAYGKVTDETMKRFTYETQKKYLKVNVAIEVSQKEDDFPKEVEAPKSGGHGHGAAPAPVDPMEAIQKEMNQFKPAIRDAVITNLSSKTSAELASAAGKELAKEQISNDINSILGGEREVLRVSFGQFIIQ